MRLRAEEDCLNCANVNTMKDARDCQISEERTVVGHANANARRPLQRELPTAGALIATWKTL